MAADIRAFISSNLLAPLKQYPTVIQDTMIEVITQRLQELYDYTFRFPEIISPNQSRLDILRAIADQFLFTVREDADIQEQIDILTNIVYVYRKRGSIDTIENMWKYYGGKLPKEVKVLIPSYKLFRYSISKLSGDHVFPDSDIYRSGVYEVRLTNSTYPIPDLREFMINELVAAGNRIIFTNELHLDLTKSGLDYYRYNVRHETFISLELATLRYFQGFTWNGSNRLSGKENSKYSGDPNILLEVTLLLDLSLVALNTYKPYKNLSFEVLEIPSPAEAHYSIDTRYQNILYITQYLYCAASERSININRYLYNMQGEIIDSRYPGYFILGESLLDEVVT